VTNKIRHFYRDASIWSLALLGVGLFMAIPLLVVLLSLAKGTGETWGHLTRYFLLRYLGNSLVLVGGVGILSTILGVSAAWVVSRYAFPSRELVVKLLYLPLAIPTYIMAYAYVGFLGNGGTLVRIEEVIGLSPRGIDFMNLGGLIWVLALSLYPYVYASCRVAFSGLPASLRSASALLGASGRRYFFTVALPLATPAIVGGVFLVTMEVLNDYGAAKYYGINTFTTGIFRTWTALEDLRSATYLAALLILFVLVAVYLSRLARGRRSFVTQSVPGSERSGRMVARGWRRWLVVVAVGTPLFFGLALPLGQLLWWVSGEPAWGISFSLAWVGLQSLLVAIAAAVACLVLALALVFLSRWNQLDVLRPISKLSVIGYAVPGAIIGIGTIGSSQLIVDFFADNYGWRIGYLFYGSSLVLLYAYAFRFLAVAYHPLEAHCLKLGKPLAEAAYLLGDGKLRALRKIELPLLVPAMVSSLFLVFVDTLKELPLTLILKPYDLNTLSIAAYTYAEDEQLGKAAPPALLLILLVAIVLWSISFGKETKR
jgi:iron(III) transport system permease protein